MATPTEPSTDSVDTLDPFRLPDGIAPIRYDVRLVPDLTTATFTGSVQITLDVTKASSRIVLNSLELDIISVAVDATPAPFRLDTDTERLIIDTAAELAVGECRLDIEFSGVLNDKLRGFYRSTYVDADGVEQTIATTQMQATDCRRAFPCWDEPAFKAVFGITLDIASGLSAFSNGPEQQRVERDGRTVITFADTMVMSSYLVAFIVGKLESTEAVDVNGTPMRVVNVPGKSHLTDYGLDVGTFCLDWFEQYYGIDYPSDKVDLAGLPDFAAGAMENLGCITFRENLLLVDPATSTQREQQLVVDVVAHELAHMWFGDLVTMRWWNGIWLNEAFATFMEIAACDAYRPDWKRWTSFGLERSAAFDVDALNSTRSVEFEVKSPADCEGMFDVLTYQKGGALLRMLEQYLGAEHFRAGVNNYLNINAYNNTETNDLWDAIEASTGQPVRRIMDSWIWQPGFPLISAALSDDGNSLELTQSRFRLGASPNDAEPQTWSVPIHVRVGDDTQTLLLDDTTLSVPLTNTAGADADANAAIVVNAGGHGFYRVAYSSQLRERLAGALSTMDTLERYCLVDDAWAATVAGTMSAHAMLEFLEGFTDEADHAVWQAVVIALRGLGRLVDDPAAQAAFQVRVRSIVGPRLVALGEPTPGEDDLGAKLRGLLLGTAGVLGNDDVVVERCRELLAASRHDPANTDAELTAAATSVVAAHGDQDDYADMMQSYLDATTPQDQLRHLEALAEFNDEQLMRDTCEFVMSPAVKTQNAPFVLRSAIANRHHGAVAWQFVKDHWAEANAAFPSNSIVRMVESVKLLASPALVDDAASFFQDNPIDQASKTLDQMLERQRINSAFAQREAGRFNPAE